MYFFSVFVMVHYEAKMHNIVGEKSEFSAMEILKKEWFYILPLVVITIFMLTGYSPGYSAILGLAYLYCRQLRVQGHPHRLHPGRGHGIGPGHAD